MLMTLHSNCLPLSITDPAMSLVSLFLKYGMQSLTMVPTTATCTTLLKVVAWTKFQVTVNQQATSIALSIQRLIVLSTKWSVLY